MFDQLQNILRNTQLILPEIIFAGVFLIVIIGLTFSKRFGSEQYIHTLNWVIIIILASICFVYFSFSNYYAAYFHTDTRLFGELIYLDNKAIFFKFIISLSAIIILLHIAAVGYRIPSEFYPIFIGMILGLYCLTMTTNLLMLYISIEMVSISSYILVAFNKSKLNAEAGIKYILYGAAASAIMLYGISLLYGMTGTLDFSTKQFYTNLLANPAWVILATSLMAMGGLLFKLSASPFHSWTPDVYEVTPTPVVSFFSIAPKVAALLALIRFIETLHGHATEIVVTKNSLLVNNGITVLLTVIIILSLTIGNFSALWQTNTKRILAYSAIAHAGFMLIGILASNKFGMQATIFYATTYLFITTAAFLLVDLLALETGGYEMEHLKGLGQQSPFLAVSTVIIMMGLVGLPPTVGFTGKFLIFSSLWENYEATGNNLILFVLVFSVLNTAISIFYYLKIPYYMIIKEGDVGGKYIANPMQYFLLGTLTFMIIYLFINPSWLMAVIEKL